MEFFDREEEIATLRRIRNSSRTCAKFTVVTGRRRVGKTNLIDKAFQDQPFIYLYVGRKTEKDLCAEFQAEIGRVLKLPMIGEASRFEPLFKAVVDASKMQPVTIVIDEFQDFKRIDESIFSSIANIWDHNKDSARLNLVVCGSIYRLMTELFADRHAPLYGRNTGLMHIEPFRASVLKDVLRRHSPNFRNEDLLALWTFTGGVARYVELLMDEGAFVKDRMIAAIFRKDSPYLEEGTSILVQEFGKDHGTYFSVMSAIASGHGEYSQIKNAVGEEIGTHLAKLESEYRLIRRKVPVFADPSSRNSVYEIDDCFFRYWFRFVWKNIYLKELGRYNVMRDYALRDYEVFSGHALEQYFRWKFMEEQKYTRMDAWWDRRGENEIDLVCDDEVGNKLDFYEVKRDPSRISNSDLIRKSEAFFAKNPKLKGRETFFKGLSIEDM